MRAPPRLHAAQGHHNEREAAVLEVGSDVPQHQAPVPSIGDAVEHLRGAMMERVFVYRDAWA